MLFCVKTMRKIMEDIIIRSATIDDAESIFHLNCDEMGYYYDLEKTKNKFNLLMNNPERDRRKLEWEVQDRMNMQMNDFAELFFNIRTEKNV